MVSGFGFRVFGYRLNSYGKPLVVLDDAQPLADEHTVPDHALAISDADRHRERASDALEMKHRSIQPLRKCSERSYLVTLSDVGRSMKMHGANMRRWFGILGSRFPGFEVGVSGLGFGVLR